MFTFGVLSNQVSTSLWRGTGVEPGFLQTLANVRLVVSYTLYTILFVSEIDRILENMENVKALRRQRFTESRLFQGGILSTADRRAAKISMTLRSVMSHNIETSFLLYSENHGVMINKRVPPKLNCLLLVVSGWKMPLNNITLSSFPMVHPWYVLFDFNLLNYVIIS